MPLPDAIHEQLSRVFAEHRPAIRALTEHALGSRICMNAAPLKLRTFDVIVARNDTSEHELSGAFRELSMIPAQRGRNRAHSIRRTFPSRDSTEAERFFRISLTRREASR